MTPATIALDAGAGAAPQVALAERIIAQHSKSFSLAARLLPADVRGDAVVLYAYCRRVDDAIDAERPNALPAALARLRGELDAVYGAAPLGEPLLEAFRRVVRARAIPRSYPDELLAGMAMDVAGTHYRAVSELLRYCFRVAGTVGLMMCHVMGVRRSGALVHAAHLGMAMQLTNIARDVLEDWQRGRLYLPDALLTRHGAKGLRRELGRPLPPEAAPAVARAVSELLDLADAYYASGDRGLGDLGPRCAFAVHVARLVYARIGRVVRARGCDPFAGRATVAKRTKLALVGWAAIAAGARWPRAFFERCAPEVPRAELAPAEALAPPRGAE